MRSGAAFSATTCGMPITASSSVMVPLLVSAARQPFSAAAPPPVTVM